MLVVARRTLSRCSSPRRTLCGAILNAILHCSATSATSAAAQLDNFQDQYLGVSSTEFTVDLDGDALTEGDIYFNSNSNKLRIFSGGQFKDAAVDTSDFAQAGFSIAMSVAL